MKGCCTVLRILSSLLMWSTCLRRMISLFFMILSAHHCRVGLYCDTRTRPNVPVPTVVVIDRSFSVNLIFSFLMRPCGLSPLPAPPDDEEEPVEGGRCDGSGTVSGAGLETALDAEDALEELEEA